jgi:hypothetical protein
LGRLRLVTEDELPCAPTTVDAHALKYANRHGVPWYLHQGTTKTGRPKYYVAKSVGLGALVEMPAGFEFSESVNGVVSVRRVDNSPKLVADADVELVKSELARHRHLRHHRVEVTKVEIVIYEPTGAMSDDELRETARIHGLPPEVFEQRMADLWARRRCQPVMCFLASTAEPGEYAVQRMRYRGEGGWSYPLAHGPLVKLVRNFVPRVGTQRFFELF